MRLPIFTFLIMMCSLAGTPITAARDRRHAGWQLDEVPWLAALQDQGVVAELQALADKDLAAAGDGATAALFAANFGPNSNLTQQDGGWTALPLLNKGRLLAPGCAVAPLTCATLRGLSTRLSPRRGAQDVGVRVLKLAPGATIRPHVGPGGRLVAHLGLRVPPAGAVLTVAGEELSWREGEFTIFDDSALHSAANSGASARYVLHVAFPVPPTSVLSVSTPHAKLIVSSDCTVTVTNLRSQANSRVEPLAHLYNRVVDNHTIDAEPCVSAEAVSPAGTVRVHAAHGQGYLDLLIKKGDKYILFEISNLSAWNADPVQKHLRLATLCPTDMCPQSLTSPPWEQSIAAAPFESGRFQGFRGSEGKYPDSAGWFTITSQFQSFTTWMFVEAGQKAAFTLCPTVELPVVRATVRSVEHIPSPSPNRARSWWWTSSSEALLDGTIAIAHSMGAELLFMGGMFSNDGDYTANLAKWPSGLAAAGKRIKDAGLQVGLHMIPTGAQTCHGRGGGAHPAGAPGTGISDPSCAASTITRPDVFVPQGLAPRSWFWPQTAGTWFCHEMQGSVCQDQTRIGCDSSVPLQANETGRGCCREGTPGCGGHIAPVSNDIVLHGATDPAEYWCRLGRYRTGGSLCFDGKATFGTLAHSEEYNFTVNKFYESVNLTGGGVNKTSEFTLQMVIHPRSPGRSGKEQVLASKPGLFKLSINARGTIDWGVMLGGKMVTATTTTMLKPVVPGVPGGYVVKATHAGGDIKVFVCALTADFKCTMPTPEGVATGSLPLGVSTSDITIGAGFDGGMEELFLYMMSLETVNAMLFSCPETGCVNWYVVDYTNAEAREWWANGTSSAFNAVGAAVSQWDGAEFQGSIEGWGVPHSDATLGGERSLGGNYWAMAQAQASLQSSVLWDQRTAVEGGGGAGLGPWKEDMAPFADEATIKGPLCGSGGDSWHEKILLDSLNSGIILNGYHTSVTLPQAELDCFIGGLVATGIAPQMSGSGSLPNPVFQAQLARVKFWLDLYKTHGMATESTIYALHYPDVFLVGLRGGTSNASSYGLLVGATVRVPLPSTLVNNATVLTYQGVQASAVNLTVPAPTNLTSITFFAANNLTLLLAGEFWRQRAITQTIIGANGSSASSVVPASAGGVSLQVQLGQYIRYSVTNDAASIAAKSDDESLGLRQVAGWTYMQTCGDTMCANMSKQLNRIIKHSDTIDTVFVGLGGAAPHYNLNHSLCYNSTSKPIADPSNSFPWATFRFGSERSNLSPLDGDGSGRYLCVPTPDTLVTAWAEPLRAAGVAVLPGISGWPVEWPVAGRDEGYFAAAVHIAKKFGFAGWSLDVEPTLHPPGSGADYLEKYATFLHTFSSRLGAHGLRLSVAEPNGNLVNCSRVITGKPSKINDGVMNTSKYHAVGHAGAEVSTMNTYYGVQDVRVPDVLQSEISQWQLAVPNSHLSIGLGPIYSAWQAADCGSDGRAGKNQTGCLSQSLAAITALGVQSVSIYTIDAFGCDPKTQTGCQVAGPVPPDSWWPLLYEWRHNASHNLTSNDKSVRHKTDDHTSARGQVPSSSAAPGCHFLPGSTCATSHDLVYVRNVTSAAACCATCNDHKGCAVSQYMPKDHSCPSCCLLKSSCSDIQNGSDPQARILCMQGVPSPSPPTPMPAPSPSPSRAATASLLIACPQTGGPFPEEWIQMDFMRGLANGSAGPPIQVDYSTSLSQLNRSRLFNYSAVLLFETPGASLIRGEPQIPSVTAAAAAGFPSLLGEYISAGGGVFLFPTEDNWKGQRLNDLNDLLGIRFPVEIINETSASMVAAMARFDAPLAFTSNVDKIHSHPAVDGVRQLWFPTNLHYNAGETAPLCLTATGPNCEGATNWTTLVRASPTAVTQAVDAAHAQYKPLPSGFFQRMVPAKAPPIFAVRTLGKGRVAMLSQWRQYTITSGNSWLFDSQVLKTGVGDRSSDTGKLIQNTLQWLAAPVAGGPGGFQDSTSTLRYPNEAPAYQRQFDPPPFTYDPTKLNDEPAQVCQTCDDHGCRNCGIAPGIIGVRTSASSGSGTVAEYAAAASVAGLGFVVFAEEWSTVKGKRTLTDAAIAKLRADCKAHSTPQLQLIPGMTIENNIGNKQIFLGAGNWTPPADALTNDSSKILLQGVDPLPPFNYTGFNTPSFNWMLSAAESYRSDVHDPQNGWTVGYYHLGASRSPGSMSMPDLRVYSMAAVAYYDSVGTLVEELHDDFAFTIEATIAPVPVVFSDIRSVAALRVAAKTQLLTHVKGAGGPSTVFIDGLRWNSQYDAPPTFVSHMDGPIIDVWPQTHRVYTLGAERFSTGSALLQAGISVRTNATGASIAEVNITNGQQLFRRFVPQPSSINNASLHRTLLLDGFVHKNLLLTVTDSAGRKAYGSPVRTWKPGVRSIVFCGDHVNDCESDGMQLGHGPVQMLSTWVPILGDELGGFTWDGGPPSQHPLLTLQSSQPQILASSAGTEDGTRFTQTPHLETSDEGGTAVRSVQDRVFCDDVERVVNAWHTFGPIRGPSRLFNYTQYFRMWFEASVGVPPTAYAGTGVEASSAATLFRNVIHFRKANTITDMLLLQAGSPVPKVSTFSVVICSNSTASPIVLEPASADYNTTRVVMSAGGWWALWSPEPSQTQLFTWRSTDDVVITIEQCTILGCFGNWFKVLAVTPLVVKPGETLTVEFAQVGRSLLAPATTSNEAVLAFQQYISHTPQLMVTRGTRLTTGSFSGLLDLDLDASGVAALSVPQAAEPHTMLPMRVKAQCDRWTLGLLQREGYTLGHYGNGSERWTALGLSLDGHAHAPLFTGLAATDIVVGHPVVATDLAGRELFIQVTKVVANDTAGVQMWHVALNNPTHRPITTRLSSNMGITELYLPSTVLTIAPGEWHVLPQRPTDHDS